MKQPQPGSITEILSRPVSLGADDWMMQDLATYAANRTEVPRAEGVLVDATTDIEAVQAYIQAQVSKRTSLKAFRRDLRKLMFFMQYLRIESLSAISVEDCSAFLAWLSNPPATHCLTGPIGEFFPSFYTKNGQFNPQWRPLLGPMKPQSIDQVLSRFRGLFRWLQAVGYLSANPWIAVKSPSKRESTEIHVQERDLPIQCIQAVIWYLETEAEKPAGVRRRKTIAQQRWIFMLMLLTSARAMSVISAKRSEISKKNGIRQIRLRVKGSGVRYHSVSFGAILVREYQRYLETLGILPDAHNPLSTAAKRAGIPDHLVLSLRNPKADKGIQYDALQKMLSALFTDAADWARHHSELTGWEVSQIEQSSGHWLRHGIASQLSEDEARNLLGHQSKAVTARYRHGQLVQSETAVQDVAERLGIVQ